MRVVIGFVAALLLAGCGSPTGEEAVDRVMTDARHSHYHVHGPGIDHGHVHEAFAAGGHTHEHDGHGLGPASPRQTPQQ